MYTGMVGCIVLFKVVVVVVLVVLVVAPTGRFKGGKICSGFGCTENGKELAIPILVEVVVAVDAEGRNANGDDDDEGGGRAGEPNA